MCPGTGRRNGVAYCQGPEREWWRLGFGQVVTVISNRDMCPLGERGGAAQGLLGRREEEAGGLRDR